MSQRDTRSSQQLVSKQPAAKAVSPHRKATTPPVTSSGDTAETTPPTPAAANRCVRILLEKAEQAGVLPAATLAPVSITLDPEASELVRWYVDLMGHREVEAVEGAVLDCIGAAKDAHDKRPHGDGAFDILVESVLAVRMVRQSRRASMGFSRRFTIELGMEVHALVQRYRDSHPGHDERDVVSAYASCLLANELGDKARPVTAYLEDARSKRESEERALRTLIDQEEARTAS